MGKTCAACASCAARTERGDLQHGPALIHAPPLAATERLMAVDGGTNAAIAKGGHAQRPNGDLAITTGATVGANAPTIVNHIQRTPAPK